MLPRGSMNCRHAKDSTSPSVATVLILFSTDRSTRSFAWPAYGPQRTQEGRESLLQRISVFKERIPLQSCPTGGSFLNRRSDVMLSSKYSNSAHSLRRVPTSVLRTDWRCDQRRRPHCQTTIISEFGSCCPAGPAHGVATPFLSKVLGWLSIR